MVARTLREWLAQFGTTTLDIAPGNPWKNGYRESFGGKLRHECLKLEIFCSLREAQVVISAWRDRYNCVGYSAASYRPLASIMMAMFSQQLSIPAIMQGSRSQSGRTAP
jgi:putative transposase